MSIIQADNISKRYILSHQRRQSYTALRDVVSDKFKRVGKRMLSPFSSASFSDPTHEEFWALKDVSFGIERGDRVGIIGRNGAGKSTLLKILSRITEPTTGRISIRGRVASLLEVGTGFHPELTGRENIYLNGAILGMTRFEIRRKFEEIVAFAEVEKFLDTPVKHYSSGMYVRLAFAVAAHLEPEILIVDEVLAVGDAQFQKKCMGKMEDVSTKEGRTVLFVSHQMGAIMQLCSKAFLLDHGKMIQAGTTDHIVDYYMTNSSAIGKTGYISDDNRDKDIYVTEAKAVNDEGLIVSDFSHREQINISILCHVNKWIPDVNVGFFVRDMRGRRVFTTENREWGNVEPINQELCATVTIPSDFLVPGQYYFSFFVSIPKVRFLDWVEDVLSITIIDAGSKFLIYEGGDYGCVFAECKWDIRKCNT